MGTMFLSNIKKQASSFLQEKYKTVRLALTDVTHPELLAEEATNDSPWGPDAKTMTRIAGASFDVDSYWRTVDVLHRRLYNTDWKKWRQSYKSLVLLEFLLTHGPEKFATEFQCESAIIQELATFQYIDENGVDWGLNMKNKSELVLELLGGGERLKQARLKALRITKEIRGFGSSSPSVSSPSSSCGTPNSSNSEGLNMSFGSYSSTSSLCDINELSNLEKVSSLTSKDGSRKYFQPPSQSQGDEENFSPTKEGGFEEKHIWDCYPIEEEDSLLDLNDQELDFKEKYDLIGGICSKFGRNNPLGYTRNMISRSSFSNVDKPEKRKLNRPFSRGY